LLFGFVVRLGQIEGYATSSASPKSKIPPAIWKSILAITLALTFGAPSRGAASNRFSSERRLMNRTFPTLPPAFVKEPALWRIREIARDMFQRTASNEPHHLPKPLQALALQISACRPRTDMRAPQDFVCHPISNPGKAALQKERRLNRQSTVVLKKAGHKPEIECFGSYSRRELRPPQRFRAAVMEENTSKLPGVGENQRASALPQNQMIVPTRFERQTLNAQMAGHSKMNPEIIVVREAEQHLFPVRFRTEQHGTWKQFLDLRRICPSKDSFVGVQRDARKFLP
jgi:hypothetical protein